jgi:soluble lytic murein transglycosylase-like protein
MNAAGLWVCAAVLAVATPAAGAVYEIGEDGSMARLDSPAPISPAPTQVRRPAPSRTANARAAVFRPFVDRAARRYEVSAALIDAIAHAESRYNQAAVSPKRAVGIMQLMPGTARQLGVDSHDPAANILGGTAYLRLLLNRFNGDIIRTIAAYNAGPGAVERARGIPRYPETVRYVQTVLDRLADTANQDTENLGGDRK